MASLTNLGAARRLISVGVLMSRSHSLGFSVPVAAVIALTACSASRPGMHLGVSDVIGWLPPNTETVIVANGPIDPELSPARGDPGILGLFALGPLATYRNGDVFRELRGSSLRFAVEGARAFRAPAGFGLAPYAGCHILVFDDSSSAAIDRLMSRLANSGGTMTKIGGLDATRVDWRSEEDNWSAFVVRLRPEVIVVATDEAMLVELTARSLGGSTVHAFPASLPEWSGVDTTARVWAIRHYRLEESSADPTTPLSATRRAANEPDTMAVGLTVHTVDGKSAGLVALYYSRNPRAPALAQRWFGDNAGISPTITPGPRGSVRIASGPNARREWADFLFVLLAALGHAIYL